MRAGIKTLLVAVCFALVSVVCGANSKALNVRDSGYALDYSGDVVLKAVSIRVTGADLTTAPLTIATLPSGAVVTEVYVNVVKAEATGATKTVDVGTGSGGDADGFLDGASVATTGVKKGTLLSSGQTLGALLRADETGSSGFVPEPFVAGQSWPVVVTAGSNDFVELQADIIIIYKEITD